MSGETKAKLVNLADVEPEEVRWLWPGRIPLGKLTILDGDPGTSKTTLALDLAARISRGDVMPDGSASHLDGPRGVVLLTAEDGLGDTIRPRLDAAAAEPKRIVALEAVVRFEDNHRLPTVRDVGALEEAIQEVDAVLLIFDPLSAYLGSNVDYHRDASVREALSALADLAEEHGVSVLGIRHLNKKADVSSAIYRGMGSIGFTASARSVLIVAKDPDDATGERRILATTKGNLAKPQQAFAYRVQEADNDSIRIKWLEPSRHTADTLLEASSGDKIKKQEHAKRWLKNVLAEGPLPVKELKARLEHLDFSWSTLQRAADELDVVKEKSGYEDGWVWRAPGDPDRDSRKDEHTANPTNEDLTTFGEEKAQDPRNDGTISKTATSQEGGHLRDQDESAKTANQQDPGHLRESPGMPGNSGDGEAEDGQPIGGEDPDGEEREQQLVTGPIARVRPDAGWS